MKNIVEKYKITIITTIIVLFICLFNLLLFKLIFSNSLIKKIDNDNYYIEFDKSWKIKQKKKDNITLKHQSGSKIYIQINKLDDNYKYSKIDELIDELKYNIKEQNKDYNLISSKDCNITKNKFKGYKLLYENGKNQVMVNLYKKGDNLVSIRYEANSKYFDILLDSVNNIIYNLNIKDEKFDYKTKIEVNTTKIEYDKNEELDKKLKDTKEYEISKNHYLVKYSIPSIFNMKVFDSTLGLYEYKKDSNNNINIEVDIYNLNIYEYLDKGNSVNVYKNYNTYREDDKNKYSDFKEEISMLDENKLSYIYKNSHYNNSSKTIKKHNIELIYELDNNHILLIKISSSEQNISKKLVDMIKVIKSTNYASYINNKKEDDFVVSELKKFTDYNYNKYDLITLKIPNKYEEIDKNSNYYIKRHYVNNYNEELELYDYNINYELTNITPEKQIKSINSIYIDSAVGEKNELTYSDNIKINDKEFMVFDGGYTTKSGILYTDIDRINYYKNIKVLFYKIRNNRSLFIEVIGNNKEITNEILNEITKFTIEEKNY